MKQNLEPVGLQNFSFQSICNLVLGHFDLLAMNFIHTNIGTKILNTDRSKGIHGQWIKF